LRKNINLSHLVKRKHSLEAILELTKILNQQKLKKMKRLLSIELQKIWMNKASRVLSLTYFTIFIAMIASIKFDVGFKIHLLKWDIQLPFHLALQHLYCCHFKIIFSIVIVSMMANEYSYGTLKQNLIDGLSKKSSFCLNFDRTLFLSVLLFRVCHEFNI
jgi:hypothetical protein